MSKHTISFATMAVFAVAGLLSISMFANGVFMIVNPALWYTEVPGVARTGAFNQHFIRDIAILYMIIGGALLGGVLRRESSVMLWGTTALWLSGHAVFHVWEVMAGLCGPETLIGDFPAVTLPALISLGLTVWAWRNPHAK
ncbi:hypothetical protein [Pseudomonas sp. DR48]|uniref:hypothetical protein n=1 Tax=Pseudomonas sp. DR48 TaxID=2871095 RepID=UPI001C9A2853|nr:hypothetical protein [Pseudomonas sp. DR48]QZP31525.1 hypothetical protein K5K95_25645 [Pseudomonas sp. DR48]